MKQTAYKFILIFFIAVSFHSVAQTGNYYLTNFSPSEYGASDQNWSTIQDQWGRIYIANAGGILLYDGKSWKVIPLRKKSRCFSLDKDKNNKI